MLVALVEDRADALLGHMGGLTAAPVFTLSCPMQLPLIEPDFGAIDLYSANTGIGALIVAVYAVVMPLGAVMLEERSS